jgi:hypothetical protein
MNLTVNTNISIHGGVIQLWNIPRASQDEESLRDEWLVRDDTWIFKFEIRSNGKALNLTGRTITLNISSISVTGIVTDVSKGLVTCTVSTGASIIPGDYPTTVSLDGLIVSKFNSTVVEDLVK